MLLLAVCGDCYHYYFDYYYHCYYYVVFIFLEQGGFWFRAILGLYSRRGHSVSFCLSVRDSRSSALLQKAKSISEPEPGDSVLALPATAAEGVSAAAEGASAEPFGLTRSLIIS